MGAGGVERGVSDPVPHPHQPLRSVSSIPGSAIGPGRLFGGGPGASAASHTVPGCGNWGAVTGLHPGFLELASTQSSPSCPAQCLCELAALGAQERWQRYPCSSVPQALGLLLHPALPSKGPCSVGGGGGGSRILSGNPPSPHFRIFSFSFCSYGLSASLGT